MKHQEAIPNTSNSRRQFLKQTGGLVFYISVPFGITALSSCESGKDKRPNTKVSEDLRSEGQDINVWVQIHKNNEITLFNPANEMGQGSMTALAVVIAEELDADWEKVHIENSPVEVEVYGSKGWRGKSMMTVGSRTVKSYYDSLRRAGAQARYILLSNVAEQWKVPLSELSTKANLVVHENSGREISYGDIASFLKPIEDIPDFSTIPLKDPKDFRIIGKVADRFDIPAKVDGSAKYSIDVQVPEMVYAVISRSPVNGSSPELSNEDEVRNLDGVLDIVPLDHGIGLIAESIEKALKAKKELQIKWSSGAKAESHSSDDAYSEYAKVAASKSTQGNVMVDEGNFISDFTSSSKTYTSSYKNDYIYHAQMEPLNALVSLADDASAVELWIGTQAPANTKRKAAEMLDIDLSKVTIHRHYLGGGFGRRSSFDNVEEAIQLAKQTSIKKPIKLLWTREDDLQYGMYRPMSLQKMQASLDKDGNISGWQHIIVGTGGGLLGSGARTDFYTFPNQHIEVRNIDHGIRTKHWRAVGHGANKFAIEAFIDEIAVSEQKDPFDLRMSLMQNHPRAQKVLQTVADMSEWKKPSPRGLAKGIAFAEHGGSLAACVCEISVNQESGEIKVHKIWTALDAGVLVQPDNVVAQMEGGIVMGISSVLKERLSIKNGEVQESNFHDYPIIRMDEVPESIEVKLIESQESPTGVGESGVPIIGGAIANAFLSLTKKKIKHLPFTPEKVLKVLAG